MTAHEFFQDGIRYVPSRVAAKSVDLAPDYISRMCREGLVLATWNRGAWYVNEKSLTDVLAARRLKQDEHALAQSESLKREREQAEAAMQSQGTQALVLRNLSNALMCKRCDSTEHEYRLRCMVSGWCFDCRR